MEARTSTYMQMQTHTQTHTLTAPFLKLLYFKSAPATPSLCWPVSSEVMSLAFEHVNQELNKSEHLSVSPFVLSMYNC